MSIVTDINLSYLKSSQWGSEKIHILQLLEIYYSQLFRSRYERIHNLKLFLSTKGFRVTPVVHHVLVADHFSEKCKNQGF